jgi:Tfp pilus assembly PilM family ATPase/cell division protein FtsB
VSRDKSILGIHINDDFLNIVYLGKAVKGLQVHSWACERLDGGIVNDGLIVHTEMIAEKIRDFIRTRHVKTHKAIISLSCSTVRLRPSEFPAQTNEQLQKQVEEQVGKYGLFGGEGIVFDYCILEHTAQSSNKQTVLQAITTRQISDACLGVAKKAGLDLVRIEPAVLPIIKLAFNKQATASESVSLLLALDSASGNLSVFKNGLPQLCQNLSVGTNDLSQGKDSFTCLIDQMKTVLEFAHSLAGSQQLVLRVVAACVSEKLRTIVSQIKQSLNDMTVEQIDCSQITKKFDLQGTDGEEVPFFALTSALTAFGVSALDGQLNLISKESLTILKTRKEMSLTAKAIVAIVLLSIAALVPLKTKIRSVEASSAEIEAKVAEAIPISKNITGLKKQIKQLNEGLSVYSKTSKELIDIPWAKALQVIGDAVPDGVRIVDILTTDSGDFTLVGEALAESCVYRFAEKLQDNKLIRSAKVEEIEYDNTNAASIVDYKITCKIQLS